MTIQFNFSQLKDVYLEALKSDDKALAFEIKIGRGRFLFMMFLSDEDEESKDLLFIYLRNTQNIVKLKMYGNHKLGAFEVYIDEIKQNQLIHELELTSAGEIFDFNNFLNQLNTSIPLKIAIEEKMATLRANRDIIKPLNIVSEADKTVLIGDKKLPKGQVPQDKTLRKLYMYTEGNVNDISAFISALKTRNRTVAWTSEENKSKAADIREMIAKLS